MSTAPHRVPQRTSSVPRTPAQFTHCPISSSIMVVTAEGEIDACNARDLADYVEQSLGSSTRLIVDLRDLQFFGTQAFSTLHTLNVTCSRREMSWVVIAGREVHRMLRICDPGGALPVAATLEEAVAAVVRGPRNHLRMLPRT